MLMSVSALDSFSLNGPARTRKVCAYYYTHLHNTLPRLTRRDQHVYFRHLPLRYSCSHSPMDSFMPTHVSNLVPVRLLTT